MTGGDDEAGARSIRLTHWVGSPVIDASGTPVGSVADLVATVAPRPTVRAVIVRSGALRFKVPWSAVDHTGGGFDRLVISTALDDVDSWRRGDDVPLVDGEVCIGRDVLDSQIVDLNGYRIVRVGDVVLERVDPVEPGEVDLVAVDVGIRSVLDRLGWRRISGHFPEQAVAWGELHLLSRSGHRAQLTTADATVHRLDSQALARLLDRLPAHAASDVLISIPVDRSAAMLHAASDDVGGRLLSTLPDEQADVMLAALPPERASRYRDLLRHASVPRRRFARSSQRSHPRWRRSRQGSE